MKLKLQTYAAQRSKKKFKAKTVRILSIWSRSGEISSRNRAMRSWYVLETKHRQEMLAKRSLERRGLETYLPLAREQNRFPGEVSPLFPGYLFAKLDLPFDYRDAVWCVGVKRLLSFGSSPPIVEDTIISFLRNCAAADGIIARPASYCRGSEVTITRGAFRGLPAVVQGLSRRARVKVLLTMLSRDMTVEVPEAWVERL